MLKYLKVILIVGHGSKNQYKKDKLEELKSYLKNDIKYLNGEYSNNWIAIYGGDNYNKDKPDIGYVINILNKENVKIAAVQSKYCEENKLYVDKYIDFVYYVETDYDNNKKVIWGGFYNGNAAGPTKIYLKEFIELGILKKVYVIGGGKISKDEVQYALNNNIDIIYRRFEVENKIDDEHINDNVKNYGFIEELVEDNKYKDKIRILE
jgi:hypothetical protein